MRMRVRKLLRSRLDHGLSIRPFQAIFVLAGQVLVVLTGFMECVESQTSRAVRARMRPLRDVGAHAQRRSRPLSAFRGRSHQGQSALPLLRLDFTRQVGFLETQSSTFVEPAFAGVIWTIQGSGPPRPFRAGALPANLSHVQVQLAMTSERPLHKLLDLCGLPKKKTANSRHMLAIMGVPAGDLLVKSLQSWRPRLAAPVTLPHPARRRSLQEEQARRRRDQPDLPKGKDLDFEKQNLQAQLLCIRAKRTDYLLGTCKLVWSLHVQAATSLKDRFRYCGGRMMPKGSMGYVEPGSVPPIGGAAEAQTWLR